MCWESGPYAVAAAADNDYDDDDDDDDDESVIPRPILSEPMNSARHGLIHPSIISPSIHPLVLYSSLCHKC